VAGWTFSDAVSVDPDVVESIGFGTGVAILDLDMAWCALPPPGNGILKRDFALALYVREDGVSGNLLC
jgi:hypothetical protein